VNSEMGKEGRREKGEKKKKEKRECTRHRRNTFCLSRGERENRRRGKGGLERQYLRVSRLNSISLGEGEIEKEAEGKRPGEAVA